MKTHRTLLALTAAALVSLGLYMSLRQQEDRSLANRETLPPLAASTANPDRPSEPSRNATSAFTETPAAQHRPSLLASGMTTSEPLAFVTQLHARGGPGAFAIADQVTVACREALGALSYFNDPENSTEIAQQLAKRGAASGRFQSAQALAAQSLESRCRPFEQPLESDEPKADDASGAAYRTAQAELNGYGKGSKAALQELARQGQLLSASDALRGRFQLEGVPSATREDRDLLMRGMTLAAFRASSDPTNQANDLRVMTECLRTGMCDGSYESVLLGDWPEGSEQRARALAIAKRLEKAFAENATKSLGSP